MRNPVKDKVRKCFLCSSARPPGSKPCAFDLGLYLVGFFTVNDISLGSSNRTLDDGPGLSTREMTAIRPSLSSAHIPRMGYLV
jgi:hypothetical protein